MRMESEGRRMRGAQVGNKLSMRSRSTLSICQEVRAEQAAQEGRKQEEGRLYGGQPHLISFHSTPSIGTNSQHLNSKVSR